MMASEPIQINDNTSNVKVLIDVSGSMKKNDPKNVRSPALRLLVGLLPADSTAGVLNFGTTVIEIVKSAKADETWKDKARKSSHSIHSRDLFTNIGQALKVAAQDWKPVDDKTQLKENRSIIILTDGMVDISKDDIEAVHEAGRIFIEGPYEIIDDLKSASFELDIPMEVWVGDLGKDNQRSLPFSAKFDFSFSLNDAVATAKVYQYIASLDVHQEGLEINAIMFEGEDEGGSISLTADKSLFGYVNDFARDNTINIKMERWRSDMCYEEARDAGCLEGEMIGDLA